jgi:transcriptional regulator with XRE-family HTH domain
LGQKICAFRRERGFSQEELAELAGLHRTYIGGVERGERNVGFVNLFALSRALGVSLSQLVEGIDCND